MCTRFAGEFDLARHKSTTTDQLQCTSWYSFADTCIDKLRKLDNETQRTNEKMNEPTK